MDRKYTTTEAKAAVSEGGWHATDTELRVGQVYKNSKLNQKAVCDRVSQSLNISYFRIQSAK